MNFRLPGEGNANPLPGGCVGGNMCRRNVNKRNGKFIATRTHRSDDFSCTNVYVCVSVRFFYFFSFFPHTPSAPQNQEGKGLHFFCCSNPVQHKCLRFWRSGRFSFPCPVRQTQGKATQQRQQRVFEIHPERSSVGKFAQPNSVGFVGWENVKAFHDALPPMAAVTHVRVTKGENA